MVIEPEVLRNAHGLPALPLLDDPSRAGRLARRDPHRDRRQGAGHHLRGLQRNGNSLRPIIKKRVIEPEAPKAGKLVPVPAPQPAPSPAARASELPLTARPNPRARLRRSLREARSFLGNPPEPAASEPASGGNPMFQRSFGALGPSARPEHRGPRAGPRRGPASPSAPAAPAAATPAAHPGRRDRAPPGGHHRGRPASREPRSSRSFRQSQRLSCSRAATSSRSRTAPR